MKLSGFLVEDLVLPSEKNHFGTKNQVFALLFRLILMFLLQSAQYL